MNVADNKRFITTGQDLCQYLQKCKTCYTSSLNGNAIVHYGDLESVQLVEGQHKTAIILNNECFFEIKF